ncbi:isoprenylcysteine carboxyl methyltransferase family protein [Bacillus alveayuensis]|jgi:methyltransferase|uniref:isoprenylcysteine carboxyl methyltransferase family protein n=1 Tax=Aeribacillus alveayuensis TaxID=279215 RepID=UPI0005CDC702|nr:isoprenylcysteine carboxylmethyltransferase family protein [Bacillus alveayuensis]
MFFYLFFAFIIVERLGELLIAKRNERWLKEKGAKEFGKKHYKYIVLVHILFLLSFWVEAMFHGARLSPFWPIILSGFLITQLLRVWTILSLGRFWNTKILVVPNAKVIAKGPYRWLRHPNYVIVALEFVLIPLLFQAYWTAMIFSLLNMIVLFIRISVEEQALCAMTNYKNEFHKHNRFFPLRPIK